MFGGDAYAYFACRAEWALQENWYPDPTGGLYSYQTWNGFDGFWQNGVVLEALANFMRYTNSSRYASVVASSARDLDELLLAYAPYPSYDDMMWYALSYTRIFNITREERFLRIALDIYDWTYDRGWDANATSRCPGGLWFDQTESYKGTIENAQFVLLGFRLYRAMASVTVLDDDDESSWIVARKSDVLKRAEEGLAYVLDVPFASDDGSVTNNVDLSTCGPASDRRFTYNAGIVAAGFAAASGVVANERGGLPLLWKALDVLNFTLIAKSDANGILVEDCAPDCNEDSMSFKGIFFQCLRYVVDDALASRNESVVSRARDLRHRLLRNAASLIVRGGGGPMCEPPPVDEQNACNISARNGASFHNRSGPVFGWRFHEPFRGQEANPMSQVSALQLLCAAVDNTTTCDDDGDDDWCTYDPPNPPPEPLTCDDAHACPVGETCCAFQGYATCCAAQQTCRNGVCAS